MASFGRPRGIALTPRDHVLFQHLAFARCLTTTQIHTLIAPSADPRSTYHRLRRLSLSSQPTKDPPFLAAYQQPAATGSVTRAWTLAPRAHAAIAHTLPAYCPPLSSHLTPQYLTHQTLLAQVYVDLALLFRASPEDSPLKLPYVWRHEDASQLEFRFHSSHSGLTLPTALKPDAILDVPSSTRRFFLEAETGTNSITTTNAEYFRDGSIASKLQRYATYFTQLATRTSLTWYSQAFPDGLYPELLLIVPDKARSERVSWVVAKRLSKLAKPLPFGVRVLTFTETPQVLAALLKSKLPPASRLLTIPEATGHELRDGYNTLAKSFNDVLAAVAAHNKNSPSSLVHLPPIPTDTILGLKKLIKTVLASDDAERPAWTPPTAHP